MRTRVLALMLTSAALIGAGSGCVWITEEEQAAFSDRDGDGLDNAEDCDDSNKNIQGTVQFYPDVDGDGFGDMNAQPKEFCPSEAPSDHVQDNTDCNDNNAGAKPGGVEVCDVQDIDEDCDGAADDADAEAEGKVRWYADADGDQYGDQNDAGVLACDPPGSAVTDNTDCNDGVAGVNPGATEVCDDQNLDEDCSGQADDADPGVDTATFIQYYADSDADGYGNPAVTGALQCDPPGGQAPNNGDCNDADNSVNPGATEVCDGADVDEDCNSLADDADAGVDVGTMSLWYPDADGDSFGDLYAAASQSCDPSGNQVADNTDCDDSRPDINLLAPEVCDAFGDDEDCDGLVNDLDPDAQQSDWWLDNDGDGYGVLGPPAITTCIGPADHASQSGDCDDTDAAINPDAKEYHDGVDSDCDVLGTDFVCGESYYRVGPAEAFQTIQSAIDAIDQVTYCDGDTIEVLPGTYVENIVVADIHPNIVGLVPANTFLQGTGTGRVVTLDRTGATFQGFHVSGGSIAGDGGGIRVFYGVDTVIDDVVVTGNQATNGGGIDLRNPVNVTVRNSVIQSNSTTTGDGGGLRVSSTGGQSSGTIRLSNLDIDGNTAGDEGGGIRVAMDSASAVSVVLEDTVLSNNSAVFGGGLSAEIVPTFTITNVDAIDNTGSANHGGLHIKQSPVIIDGLLLEQNSGATVAALQIQEYDGPVSLSRVVAVDNVLTGPSANGSAILLKGDESDGSVLHDIEVARTSRTAGPTPLSGAGLYIEGKVAASNVLIYDESGPYGLFLLEAASAIATTHDLSNVTVAGCDDDGIGVGMAIASAVSLTNAIVAHNGGIGINQTQITATVSYTDTFGNTLGNYAGSNPVGTNGNIDLDPLFLNYSAFTASSMWDLTLGAGSPCIDTGNPGITDADGSASDMGYYGGAL